MLITKREAVEIMLRPQPVPEEFYQELIDQLMRFTAAEIMDEFLKSTHLTLLPAGGDHYMIKY